MKNNKRNVCGIIGLSTGWLVPISGLVLGIIALGRKEPNKNLGVLSIIMSVLSAGYWAIYYSYL